MARRRCGPFRSAGVAALALFLSIGVGCSSEILQPATVTPLGEEGEVSIEPIYEGLPTPSGLNVQALNPNCLCLTWNRQARPYLTHIQLDGVTVGQVDARLGRFTQAVGKFAGPHTYTVCFGRGCRTGSVIRIDFFIPPNGPPEPVVIRAVEDS